MSAAPSATSLGKRRAPLDPLLSHPARRPPPPSSSTSFAYNTPLLAHKSCVNALAISSGNGSWLASGGDDKIVQLWRVGGWEGEQKPKTRYKGARANIFSISFNSTNTKLYSAGADSIIYCHDLETSSSSSTASTSSTGAAPTDVYLDHDDAVHAVKCHPTDPCLFLSASDDGFLLSFDSRTPGGPIGVLAERSEMTDVAYHPLQPNLFASADGDGSVLLLDGRMCWSDVGSAAGEGGWQGRVASEVAVLQYSTSLLKPLRPSSSSSAVSTFSPASPSCSSLTFSPTGSLLCATLSQYLPTLFEISSPEPLATFSAPSSSSSSSSENAGPRKGYRNTTTTKKGSMSEVGGKLLYAAGSDDFNAYVWEVPDLASLRKGRRYPGEGAGVSEWFDGPTPLIAFASSPTSLTSSSDDDDQDVEPIIPPSLSTPRSILSAHRSIVNTALFHPTLPLLFTCGIEKLIAVHSSSPFPPSSAKPFVPRVPRPSRAGLDTRDEEEEDKMGLEEDEEALEWFDSLLEDEDGVEGALWRDGHGRGCLGLSDGDEDEEVDEETLRTWEAAFGEDEDEDEEGEEGEGEGWGTGTEQDSDSGISEGELEVLMMAGRRLGRGRGEGEGS